MIFQKIPNLTTLNWKTDPGDHSEFAASLSGSCDNFKLLFLLAVKHISCQNSTDQRHTEGLQNVFD